MRLAVEGVHVVEAHAVAASGLALSRRRRRLGFGGGRSEGRDGLFLHAGLVVHGASRLLRWTVRATSVSSRIISTRVRAEPQARSTMFACGCRTSLKIW